MKIPTTEQEYKKSKSIDKLSTKNAIKLMLEEQSKSTKVINNVLDDIEKTVNAISRHLIKKKDSRLIYVGAGTSGRIGMMDGVELIPTFGWPTKRLEFIIAGGNKAAFKSVENAEDDEDASYDCFKNLNVNKNDIVIGIAASGNTPFTCNFLKLSHSEKALTIAISNNPNGKILSFGKYKITLDTGQEVVAGSTRLKAGTAQKICLNIISTMVMTNLGFVRNGLMTNLIPNNKKLADRIKRIRKINKVYENRK